MYLTQDQFSPIKSITGVTTVDATADSIAIYGEKITFKCVAGNIWLNPNATAVADATALKLVGGQEISFVTRTDRALSIISDVTTATYQIIKWGSVLN